MIACPPEVAIHARLSLGVSHEVIYQMVARALLQRDIGSEVFVDVGCGTGQLWRHVGSRFTRYVGLDAVFYEGTPAEIEFHRIDLENGQSPLPDGIADVAAAVETIEHLENPRALFRELYRVAKHGGWVVVTTPNQLSFLSLLTLIFKQQFNAFQDVHYPAHLTALLETDLRRMAGECNLKDVAVEYSLHGRIISTPWHYPRTITSAFPRGFSDNLLLIGRKPG